MLVHQRVAEIDDNWKKTALIVKDPSKGIKPENCRPINCLLLSKTLLYNQLENQGIIVDEQKACQRFTRGTKDHLLIHKAALKNCKS